MTKVVSFITQKGGTGKTTMTILSATYLHSLGANVFVIDADFPQYSFYKTRDKDLMDLKEKRERNNELVTQKPLPSNHVYPVLKSTVLEVSVALTGLIDSKPLDFVFIDVPGTLNNTGINELIASLNLMIIPAELEFKSITAALETMSFIRAHNPNAPISLLWTQIKRNHRVAERVAYEDYFRQKHADCYIFRYMLMETVRVSQLLNTITPQPEYIKDFANEVGALLLKQQNQTVNPV